MLTSAAGGEVANFIQGISEWDSFDYDYNDIDYTKLQHFQGWQASFLPYCQWSGITCSSGGFVTGINISAAYMSTLGLPGFGIKGRRTCPLAPIGLVAVAFKPS